MDPEILARYAERRVPRYTSYPTAPNFSPAVGESAYRSWLAGLPERSDVSVYLHVPFCRSMCWYCGCHTTITARREPVSRYRAALAAEARLISAALPGRMRLRHLHLGGGSPTLLSAADLALLMGALRDAFDFVPGAELAIEVDPRTLDGRLAAALGAWGFNRASIGVQSFDPRVQEAINRVQSFEITAEAVESLRRHGIRSINFDLVYGLPHQDVASCIETVRQAAALRPDRLAVFGYAHVPSFKPHQRKIGKDFLPGAAERHAQSQAIAAELTAAGYRQIGLDHFALPGEALARAAEDGRLHRNFQGYTADPCATLIGLGASAISRLPDGYAQNSVLVADYQRRVLEGRLPVVRGCSVSAGDAMRAAVIERLMCDHRVDLAAMGAEGLLDEIELTPLAEDGLIDRHGSTIEVREEARPLVRAVAAAFDAYLDDGGGRHVGAV